MSSGYSMPEDIAQVSPIIERFNNTTRKVIIVFMRTYCGHCMFRNFSTTCPPHLCIARSARNGEECTASLGIAPLEHSMRKQKQIPAFALRELFRTAKTKMLPIVTCRITKHRFATRTLYSELAVWNRKQFCENLFTVLGSFFVFQQPSTNNT